jgi:D-sedoheptulose 7-phosphate isomerase
MIENNNEKTTTGHSCDIKNRVMSYNGNYLRTFAKGLNQVVPEIENKEVDSNLFLERLINQTKNTHKHGGRIFFFGNGASASFANHMALDWSKNGGVISLSLSDSALLTALSNDYSYEDAFREFAKINKLCKNDIVVAISSSGNSPNIVSVLEYSKEVGALSMALNGLKPTNKSREIADYSIYFPFKTYGMVECAHQLYLHLWLDAFMQIFEWDRNETQNMNIKEFKL